MNQKKKRKNNKKLSSLILLLLLTTVMLSTSTYAWFTANKTVKIDSINVHVETSGGLQISTDASTWKTVITNGDITGNAYSGNTNQFPSTLNPTSSPLFINNDGTLAMYTAVTGANADGDYTLTTTKATDAQGTSGSYIAFDIFLKNEPSNASDTGNIYLTNDSDVVIKSETTDKGLKNAARVAFVAEGNNTDTTLAASTYTGYTAAANTTGTNVYLWEPNYDVHTANGVTAASEYYGITTSQTGGTKLAYKGVKDEMSDVPLKDSLKSAAEVSNGFIPIDSSNLVGATFLQTPADNATNGAYQVLFTKLGVTKVRVYMWIEGQDVDCENNASGSDIVYNIQLSKNSSASGA